jgi:hypothetical protein
MNAKKIAKVVKDYLEQEGLKIPKTTNFTLKKLTEVVEGAIEYPTPEDIEAEKASHYLSDGDISIKEMVAAIRNHPDADDFIDDVEGVVVWQPLEYRYTCTQFLELL